MIGIEWLKPGVFFGSMLFGLVLRRQKGRAPITREGRD